MIALGSGEPTRVICSVLIAQAFEAVRYPILPKIAQIEGASARRDIMHIQHSSLYAPRDFDISPYFDVVKPTLANGFDYRALPRADFANVDSGSERASVSERDCNLVSLSFPAAKSECGTRSNARSECPQT